MGRRRRRREIGKGILLCFVLFCSSFLFIPKKKKKKNSLNMSKRANKGEKKQLTKVCQKLKDYVEQRHQQDLLRFEQEEKEEKESKEAMTEEKEQK